MKIYFRGRVAGEMKRYSARRRKMRRTRNPAMNPWQREMRVKRLNGGFKVTITAFGVDEFRNQWPFSGMPFKGFSAKFDSRGDLVDLTGWALNFRGDQYGLNVLIDDMRDYGRAKLRK